LSYYVLLTAYYVQSDIILYYSSVSLSSLDINSILFFSSQDNSCNGKQTSIQ